MTTISLTSDDGTSISAYITGPEDAAAGMVVVQEIFGVNAHIRSVADRYAELGYRVVAPAFFDRVKPDIELDYNEQGIVEGVGFANALSWDNTMADIDAAIDVLARPCGVVGYCWGGSAAWLAASRTQAKATVGYYGGRIGGMLEDTPTVPTMQHFGEHDESIPMTIPNKLLAAYPKLPVHVYDAGHGFNCDARGSYNAEAADEAYSRTIQHFAKYLPRVQ